MNAMRDTHARVEYSAEQLRVILARAGMSGRELARRLGFSPNWVSLRATAQQVITHEDAIQIADVLGISLKELADNPPNPKRGRLAPVLGDAQDFVDDPRTTPQEKQFLLKSVRGLLNILLESRS